MAIALVIQKDTVGRKLLQNQMQALFSSDNREKPQSRKNHH